MQLGAYTTVRKLGAGGMGEVYLAEHRHLSRRAAVKVLLPEISRNEELVTRFFNEARATSSLRHPSIVEVFDCDVLPNGQAYIVMEFLEGEPLAATLQRSPEFRNDVRRLCAITGLIADALQVAHGKHIVHRDLKPDNVFLSAGASFPSAVDVKLLDFGIAKLIDDNKGSNTRTGSLLGTPLYMSPEQCRGAGLVDHRTDIYSLGCMTFEMLCGRPPFLRPGTGELLVAHMREQPPPVATFRPDVPPVIANLVSAMLQKDPVARPQSLRDVLNVLERYLGVPTSLFPALVAPPAGFPTGPGAPRATTPMPRVVSLPPTAASPFVAAAPAMAKNTTLGASVSVLDRVVTDVPRRRLRAWHMLIPVVAGSAAFAAVMLLRGGEPALAPDETTTAVREIVVPEPPAPPVATRAPAPPLEVNVEIGSTPEGAEVWLPGDSQARGRTPVSLKLPRGLGQQALTIKAPGYMDAALRVDRSKDGVAAVELMKVPRAPERRSLHKTVAAQKGNKKVGAVVTPTAIPSPTANHAPIPIAPYRAVGD